MEYMDQEIDALDVDTYDQWSPLRNSNNNGIITVNTRWIIKYCNKAARTLLSLPSTSIVEGNFWEVCKHLFAPETGKNFHKAPIKNGFTTFFQSQMKKKYSLLVTSVYNSNTLCICFKKLPINVKEPNDNKSILINHLYNLVSEITNSCLWDWDLKTNEILWINGGHKKLFGYDIEDTLLPQDFWQSRIHTDDRQSVITELNEVLTKRFDTKWRIEYRFKNQNNDYIDVLDTGRILYDENNIAYRIVGATQDVSDLKNSERKLIESENKLSLVVEQSSNIIIITDYKGIIIYVNKAFTTTTGYSNHEVYGRTQNFLSGKDTDKVTVQFIKKMVNNRLPFTCRIAYYSKIGNKFWMNVQGQPLEDKSNIPRKYFFVKSDITQTVQMEERLLSERHSKQKEITGAVLSALEVERNRIGTEIHDNLNHTLVAAKLYLEIDGKELADKTKFVKKASSLIGEVIEEIRKISQTLVTTQLLGLIAHIKTLVTDLKLITPIRIELSYHGFREKNVNENLKLNIFRIIQEQLTNIIKHAEADKVQIVLRFVDGKFTLKISDDGNGCNIAAKTNGIGLRNILTRVELFNGKLDIVASPGNGFTLNIQMQQ